MIIQPIKVYNIKSDLGPKINQQTRYNIPVTRGNDILQMSFTGLFETSTIPINLEQAQEYSTIHCPNCGVKMLSHERREQLIKQASNAKNAGELLDIIRENKEYIANKFLRIFTDVENIPEYEKLSIPELREKLTDIAIEYKRKETHAVKDFLNEYAQNFPDEKCKKAMDIVRKMHTKQNFLIQKDVVEEYITALGLNDEDAKYLKTKVQKNILFADDYFRLFNSSVLKDLPESEYGGFIIKRLYYPTLNKIIPISNLPSYENIPNNKVLICNGCASNKSKNVFWRYDNARDFKNNVRQYLTDISYLMGNKEMDYSEDYVKAFTAIVNKITKSSVSFTLDEIKSIKNVGKACSRHESFTPIEQTEVDIPCAECGSIMLPHKKRKQIELEMKKCNTPYEYAQVLTKYDKYIGKHHRTLAKMFLNIVNENPYISKEDFIKEFSIQEHNYTKDSFERAFAHFYDERSFILNNRSVEQLNNYDIFAQRLKNYLSEGKFEDFDISPMLRECMQDIDFTNYPVRSVYLLVRDLNNIDYRHKCTGVGISTNKIFDDKDGVYTILFNLFKYNVATADHLVAENKGGEGDKNNLIGLCKSCNRTKSQKKVKNWLADGKKIIQNLKKQLRIVNSMAKSGMIHGYDDWAKNITQKIFQLTKGKYDLREEFD